MIESPSLEEENIMKDVRNPFGLNKLEKGTNDVAIKSIRNLFLDKEKKCYKERE